MRLVTVVWLAFVLPGCISVDEAITKHGDKVEPHIAKLREIEKTLAALPLLEADTLSSPSDLVIDASRSPSSDANTAIVYFEDLEELGALGNIYARLDASLMVPECASFLAHRTYPWDPRVPNRWEGGLSGWHVEDQLERCARLRYVLVIRTTELTRPANVRIDEGAKALEPKNYHECATEGRCKFDGGRFVGEAHLFGLSTAKHHGGARFDAESSERKKFDSLPNAEEFLENDLEASVAYSLNRLEGLSSAKRTGLTE